jgi:hypothetical protein
MVERLGDPAIMEMTALMDSLPYTVKMAFEGKGKTFFTSELILIDNNDKDMNEDVLLKNPTAFRRRFIYLDVKVKPEFRQKNLPAIDPEKSLNAGGNIMDRWLFTVSISRAVDNKLSDTVVDLIDADIYGLTDYLKERFSKHITIEGKLLEMYGGLNKTYDGLLDDLEIERKIIDDDDEKGYDPPCLVPDDTSIDTESVSEVYVNTKDYFYNKKHIILFDSFMQRVKSKTDFVCDLGSSSFGVISMISSIFFWVFMYLVFKLARYGYGKEVSNRSIIFFKFSRIRLAISILMCILLYYYGILSLFGIFPMISPFVSMNDILLYLGPSVLDVADRKCHSKIMGNCKDLMIFVGAFSTHRIFRSYWWTTYGKTLATMLAISTAFVYFYYKGAEKKKEKRVCLPESAIYEKPYTDLNDYEKRYGCGNSYERLAVKDHQLWNQRVYPMRPVFNGDPFELAKSVSKNVHLVKVGNNYTHIMGIKGDLALVNTHAFENNTKVLVKVPCVKNMPESQSFDTIVDVSRKVDIGNDLSIISLNFMKFGNILKHFISGPPGVDDCAAFIGSTPVRARYEGNLIMNNPVIGDIPLSNHWSYDLSGHAAGYCGIPLIIKLGNGAVIAGMHSGGSNNSALGVSTIFTRDLIEKGCKTLLDKSDRIEIFSESSGVLTMDPIRKSPFRHEILHNCIYKGKLPGSVLIRNKSKIRKSKLYPEVEELLADYKTEEEYAPPLMEPRFVDGQYVSPYNLALKKMCKSKAALDPSILNLIVKKYSDHIITELKKKKVANLAPLNIETAVNGALHDPFIKRINANTSAGYGWGCIKAEQLPKIDEIDRELSPELRDKVISILKAYEDKETVEFIFSGKLKDEPRLIEKVKTGKTRLFMVSPIESIIISRMFLQPFYSLMVQFGDVFGTAVGINMDADAKRLVSKLESKNDKWVEGDYGSFDQTIPFDISYAASTVMRNVLRAMGYNEYAMNIVNGLISDNLFPHVEVNLDLLVVPGYQPSGKHGTAEDNSLKNNLLFMYAWYSHPILRDYDFFEHVYITTYGDDVLLSVAKFLAKHFDNFYYQKVCEEIFLMSFTSAKKGEPLEQFVTRENSSYLRRNFVFHKDLGCYVAALNIGSVFRMLKWTIPSSVIDEEHQMRGCASSALKEMFLHIDDEKTFSDFRGSLIERMCRLYQLSEDLISKEMPTYRDYLTLLSEE